MANETTTPFTPMDISRFKAFHWRSMFTTGMGVFTDGYDLSSIGIVLPFVLVSMGIKHLVGWESSLLVASALAGAAIGALLFGVLANKGRKTFYGIDMVLMTVGGLMQAFVPNIEWLIVARVLLGIGAGADYVLSPMIMVEHSNAQDRGKTIATGFGLMWGLGAILASLVYMGMMALGVPHDIVWRVTLGVGALPSLSVIYLRRRVPETARYLVRIAGKNTEAETVIESVDAQARQVDQWASEELKDTKGFGYYFATHAREFIVASVLWFLFDIVGYAGNLFGPSLLAKGMGLSAGTFGLVMFAVFSLPGKGLAIGLIDRWGRKPLQVWGSIGEVAALILFIGLHGKIIALPLLGLIIYGAYTLMGSMGPGSVTTAGIYGVELAPTRVRSLVQGITVASGRIGATLTSFVFPLLFKTYGQNFAVGFLAALTVIAAILTAWGLPETKQVSLEVSSRESVIPAQPLGVISPSD